MGLLRIVSHVGLADVEAVGVDRGEEKIIFSENKFYIEKSCNFAVQKQGIMAEWLGEGLQNLLRRFDSVWYLQETPVSCKKRLVFFCFTGFYTKNGLINLIF